MQHVFQEELADFVKLGKNLGLVDVQFGSDSGAGGKYLRSGQQPILDCTRLDYLGIGEELKIKTLMLQAILKYDIACPASQIVTKPALLDELEQKVSSWQKLEKSLIFTSGYSVNVNVLQALGLRMRSPQLRSFLAANELGIRNKNLKTLFFMDRFSHYSMMHGVRIAQTMEPDSCLTFKFDCSRMETLEQQLESQKSLLTDNIGVIVSDTLISGNGNRVDLLKLYELAARYNCLLYLDEAHATGALGKDGRGLSHVIMDLPHVERERVMIMGTFTKTFSQLGGYVSLGSTDLTHMIRACSPQYMFSGPLLPWMAAVLVDTIELFSSPWGAAKRQSLQEKSDYLRQELNALGFDTMGSVHHIVPMLIGSEEKTFALQDKLLAKGFHIAAFHYPAVPKGKAILRFSVCDDMSYEELAGFIDTIKS